MALRQPQVHTDVLAIEGTCTSIFPIMYLEYAYYNAAATAVIAHFVLRLQPSLNNWCDSTDITQH